MRFVETPIFTRIITGLLDDEDYRRLQIALMLRPEQGPIIRGAGGLRSDANPDTSARADRTGGIQVKAAAFQELVASVRQAGRIRRGRVKAGRITTFRPTDVKAVRAKLGASQSEFALMIGVSVATLRNWEQGRRTPDGPALALLRIAAKNPEAVMDALHGARGAA